MPGIDFLEFARNEDIIYGNSSFGICDDPGELPSFVSYNKNEHTWIAKVSNPSKMRIQFLPVDKHIPILGQDKTEVMRCDAMLLTFPLYDKDIIIFIELKDVNLSSWNTARKHAIEQLRETIEYFSKYHQLDSYKKRLAYVANRRRPQANRAYTNDILSFRKDYRITLKITANITLS